MTEHNNNINGVYLDLKKSQKKTVFQKAEAKLQSYRMITLIIIGFAIFFILGAISGAFSESKKNNEVFFEKQLAKQDSLISIQHNFMQLYVKNRIADKKQQKMHFRQLYNADSVMMVMITRMKR